MIDGVFIKVLFWDNLLDDFFHEVLTDLFIGNIFVVLSGDDDDDE